MEKKVQQVSNIFNMKIAHVITDTIITTTNIIHIHDIKNALTKGIWFTKFIKWNKIPLFKISCHAKFI